LFTTPRFDADKLPLDQKRLLQARDLAQEKTESVVRYAAGGRCRQQLLLEYFGELEAAPCKVCDFCLAAKKVRQAPAPTTDLRQQLLDMLKAKPQMPREILTHFAPGRATAVTEQLRELVEMGELKYAPDGRLG
jgi:ATP-dependent DNA helicase RecQ